MKFFFTLLFIINTSYAHYGDLISGQVNVLNQDFLDSFHLPEQSKYLSFLNKYIRQSFKSQIDHKKSALKYLINLITFWSISTLVLKILITSGFDPKIAKLIPIPIIAPLSFISLRFFVFNKPII
jgi:hypothetical protein